jgi:hypothetical protein
MHRVTDRITRRHAGAAQQQDAGRGKVLTVPFARAQEESRERGLVGLSRRVELLPGALREIPREKFRYGLELLRGALLV